MQAIYILFVGVSLACMCYCCRMGTASGSTAQTRVLLLIRVRARCLEAARPTARNKLHPAHRTRGEAIKMQPAHKAHKTRGELTKMRPAHKAHKAHKAHGEVIKPRPTHKVHGELARINPRLRGGTTPTQTLVWVPRAMWSPRAWCNSSTRVAGMLLLLLLRLSFPCLCISLLSIRVLCMGVISKCCRNCTCTCLVWSGLPCTCLVWSGLPWWAASRALPVDKQCQSREASGAYQREVPP